MPSTPQEPSAAAKDMATPRRGRACCCLVPMLVLVACLLHRRVDEAELLLRMKRMWGDPPALAAWTAANSAAGAHCRWPYVRCDSADRVTSLTLVGMNITGPISDAIGGLSSLAKLDLSNNSITGMFPTVLYRCGSLQYLNLSYNDIGGELPHDIGPCTTTVLLAHSLPSFGKHSPGLYVVEVDDNKLTGAIPEWLCAQGRLQYFTASNNQLNGIPEGLAQCATLEVLDLNSNQLSGKIPANLGYGTPQLQVLYLGSNQLAGEIPSNLIYGAPLLRRLNLANNNLSGSIC